MKKATRPKDPLTRKALKALQSAVAQVVEEHRREGRPLAEWQNGRAVLVPAGTPSVVRETPSAYKTRRNGKKS
jgi:uncharacterized protein YicC (UPF0701 family)